MENTTELVLELNGDLFTDVTISSMTNVESVQVMYDGACHWEFINPDSRITMRLIQVPIWINIGAFDRNRLSEKCKIVVTTTGDNIVPVEICGEYIMIKDTILRRYLSNHKKVVIEIDKD